MYNNKQKWNHAASKLPEENFFQYVHLRMKNKIALTAHQSAQLKKSKIVQRYALDCHHPILYGGCRIVAASSQFLMALALLLTKPSWESRRNKISNLHTFLV